jgi:hypothetical protein
VGNRLGIAVSCLLLGCCTPNDLAEVSPETHAWTRGLQFLASRQDADGGFRSTDYGILKPGCSLTAIALFAFAVAPDSLRAVHADAITRGLGFLREHTDENGAVGLSGPGLDYPNYTSSFYLLALTSLRPDGWEELARRQILYLRGIQLTESRGWDRSDKEFGGFALGGRPTPKPLDAELVSISVTSWVLEALHAAGLPPGDPTLQKSLIYVARCQNFESESGEDGGFFFTPAPEFLSSKAGTVRLPNGTEELRSYGSATSDGIRALLTCHEASAPRVQAALAWIRAHFTVERTPGFEPGVRPSQEAALRMYYDATLARALSQAGETWPWRAPLTEKLLKRQQVDGSWIGWSDLMKEDDPLVATPLALIALAATR